MTEDVGEIISSVGDRFWARFLEETNAVQNPEYSDLLDIKTLEGHGGTYVKVFSGDRVLKGSFMSISLGPMGRYINIHLMPKLEFDAPRMVFEGMMSPNGAQLSLDLFPDKDLVMGFDAYEETYKELLPVYDAARANKEFVWENSRVMFMRTLFSPLSLLSFGIQPKNYLPFEDIALAYVDFWAKQLKSAKTLNPEEIQIKLSRREKMKQMLINGDPDRARIVAVFGEETVSAMEEATML